MAVIMGRKPSMNIARSGGPSSSTAGHETLDNDRKLMFIMSLEKRLINDDDLPENVRVICSDGQVFHANKRVLLSSWKCFFTFFEHAKPGGIDTVKLPHTSSQIIKLLIAVTYGDEVHWNPSSEELHEFQIIARRVGMFFISKSWNHTIKEELSSSSNTRKTSCNDFQENQKIRLVKKQTTAKNLTSSKKHLRIFGMLFGKDELTRNTYPLCDLLDYYFKPEDHSQENEEPKTKKPKAVKTVEPPKVQCQGEMKAKHLKEKHGSFECGLCSSFTSTGESGDLKEHLNAVHGTESGELRCPFCNLMFKTYPMILEHVFQMHDKQSG